MNRNAILLLVCPLLAVGCASPRPRGQDHAQASSQVTLAPEGPIVIARGGTRPITPGPAAHFTGDVTVERLFQAPDPARTSGGLVTFQPGARSAWHTHPLGQTLIVTAGVGRVQSWGGPVEEFRAGDVVWIPPGVKHWHGASPTAAMSHIAIQEGVNGTVVNWLEKVTEDQYAMTPDTHTSQSTTTPAAAAGVAQPSAERRSPSPDEVRQVTPALERYTRERLYGQVWNRPGLSKRDRSIVTISAMIARGQTGDLAYSFGQALDHGVTPSEISEIITHLAFYSGWGSAFGAVGAARDVFAQRGVGPDQLPPAKVDLLPLDEGAEARRASGVEANFGSVSPGVVQYTTDPLFRELWRRPGLAPRDRSLVTVSALIASGQPEQVTYHLNRAMDNGLSQQEASEMLTQLAFYAGWPKVFSAMPVVKDVFAKRGGDLPTPSDRGGPR
ncbi:MAG: cupin domain-containing protein [Leptolyngbya sp. PLA3]|nr:cupin domain-containing protein [Leptolyngbya sp. PL-A3]